MSESTPPGPNSSVGDEPQLPENAPTWSGSSPPADVQPGQRMKVLMADDNEMMRLLLNAQLSAWGLEVISAKDGQQAWELFQQYEPPLVLTDWMMPGIDGLELIRRIRAHPLDHYVYVVLLTAKTEKEDLVLAMDAGADDFLNKSCDNQELRVRLREGTRILRLERTLEERNREIRNAQAALVQSEKLASLGQLAAGMAHEINNPIAYVTNNLTVLRRDIAGVMEILNGYRALAEATDQIDKEALEKLQRLEQDHDLEWIEENTPRTFQACIDGLARVRDIVRDLREFARLDESDFDTVHVTDMIRSTLAMMQHLIDEKDLRVKLEGDEAATLFCRPAAINQVLHNLLMNAIQACERRDRIAIVIRQEDADLILEVRDSGRGIAESQLPRIFEPFYTTREVGEGKGLGLAHCYGVVHDHGGTIDVQSESGVGTTVRVVLPRHGREHDHYGPKPS